MATTLAEPVRFGTHADLIGYDLDEDGGALALTLHWKVQQPLLPPHHVFVHLDEASGITLAQDDGAPITARWPRAQRQLAARRISQYTAPGHLPPICPRMRCCASAFTIQRAIFACLLPVPVRRRAMPPNSA